MKAVNHKPMNRPHHNFVVKQLSSKAGVGHRRFPSHAFDVFLITFNSMGGDSPLAWDHQIFYNMFSPEVIYHAVYCKYCLLAAFLL